MTLQNSGYGVHIDSIFCGAPMYADDLAPISGSPAAMLDILPMLYFGAARSMQTNLA